MAEQVQFGYDMSHVQNTVPFDSIDIGMLFVLARILTSSLEMFDLFQLPAVEEDIPVMGVQDPSMTSDSWSDGMIVDCHIVSPGAYALNVQSTNEGSSGFKPIQPSNSEAGNTLSSVKPKKRYAISIYSVTDISSQDAEEREEHPRKQSNWKERTSNMCSMSETEQQGFYRPPLLPL